MAMIIRENAPFNFMGLPPEYSDENTAQIVIVPVPFEQTVSYGGGTAKGPDAIIDASRHVEWYDRETGREFAVEKGIYTAEPFYYNNGDALASFMDGLKNYVRQFLANDKFVCTLGGEHSISLPVIEAHHERYKGLSVLQFDAHADLREEYDGTPYSHACVMRHTIDKVSAVQVGIRSLCKEEQLLIEERRLPVFFAQEMKRRADYIKGILAALTDEVYITIDLDVFDCSLMPATGTPEPGGLNWFEVCAILDAVARSKKIVGCDIVELAPIKGLHAPDFLAAKIAYKTLNYAFMK